MKNRPMFSLVAAMVIFGTIGIFRRYLPLPSGFIAFARGALGAIFIIVMLWMQKKPVSLKRAGKNLVPLVISGALMGFNWMLLFEAYNYTSVAAATLCYYMAPIFVIGASPLLFGEKLTAKKALCVCGAVLGMLFVSGITESGFGGISELKGILMGLLAAVLYACVVLTNKKIEGVEPFDKTVIQLGSAAAVLLPYTVLTEELSAEDFSPFVILMLMAVGIVHTGIAYLLYFGSIGGLKAQTTALFSYIDPVVAIILSAALLGEEMSFFGAVGAVLILGCAVISELPEKEKTPR